MIHELNNERRLMVTDVLITSSSINNTAKLTSKESYVFITD